MVAAVEPRATATALWLSSLALSIYVFTAGGSLTTSDAVGTFEVTENLVEHGSVAMSGNVLGRDAQRGRDGRYYSPNGIVQSLYNIPFYLAGRTMVAVTGFRSGKPDTVPKAAVAMGQTLVATAIVWFTFRLAVIATGSVTAAGLAALTLAFSSVLWPYARFGFNQPLACLTLLGAVTHAVIAVRTSSVAQAAIAGVWLALSLLTRHEMALGAVPITLMLAFSGSAHLSERTRRAAAFALIVLAGVGVWLAYNAMRFGNPLDSGFLRDPTPGFGYPISAGVMALLFSPSASVLLYSPFAIVGIFGLWRLFQRERHLALMLASLSVIFLLFYASLSNWLAGRSYGSRYLLVILPYLTVGWAAWLVALAPRARNLAFVVVATIGCLLQAPGVLVDYAKVSQAAAARDRAFTTEERQWTWEASPLVLNTRALVVAVPENLRYVTGAGTPPSIAPAAGDDDHGFSQQFAFSLDFWWLYLFYLGALSRAAILAVVIAALGWIAYSARGLARALAPSR